MRCGKRHGLWDCGSDDNRRATADYQGNIMAKLFKKVIVRYLDADGKRVSKDLPGARKVTEKSAKWYGRIPGKPDPVPLCSLKSAAQTMYNKLLGDAAMGTVGLSDPFAEHRDRPLEEHLADWQAFIAAKGKTAKHVRQMIYCTRQVFTGCCFVYLADLSAARVQVFLAELRENNKSVPQFDPTKDKYTKAEVAKLLGVKPGAVPPLVKRHRLAAVGNGKARRFPAETVKALLTIRGAGRCINTSNRYLTAVKAFCRWLVDHGRLDRNPLTVLRGDNAKVDRRHDRRALLLTELRAVFQAARQSGQTFRGLMGRDRAILYAVAAASGFRAGELASLRPGAFDLDAEAPTVTLSAEEAKNGKTAVQPLPPDVAGVLRGYLADRAGNQPVWPGSWCERAADMLRIDLDAAGIPYSVEGPDGPLFADFHALRHSFIALLDKSGATLKEAMQLARHSDPKLTMAVYGRAQLHDLAEAVGRLPALLDEPTEDGRSTLPLTGTDDSGLPSGCRLVAVSGDRGCDSVIAFDKGGEQEDGYNVGRNPKDLQGFAADCEALIAADDTAPCRTRTYNPLIKSQLLCQLS